MSKEQRIDLNSLRVGDKVTLTFEVYSGDSGGRPDVPVYLRHGADEDFCLVPRHDYYGTVQRAPRPLEVGDHVKWIGFDIYGKQTSQSAQSGFILCIAGTQAWIESNSGNRFTAYLHELTRVDS